MTIDELINRFGNEDVLIARMKLISEEIAINALALAIDRIQKDGLPGKKYSENKLPAYFFYETALNAGGRNLLKKKQSRVDREAARGRGEKVRKNDALDALGDGISYKEWREANGLQTDHIDLTYSGRMFQNLHIIGTVQRGDNFVTILGASDKETKDKLGWNEARFGDFLKLAHPDDIKDIQMLFKTRIGTVLRDFFN